MSHCGCNSGARYVKEAAAAAPQDLCALPEVEWSEGTLFAACRDGVSVLTSPPSSNLPDGGPFSVVQYNEDGAALSGPVDVRNFIGAIDTETFPAASYIPFSAVDAEGNVTSNSMLPIGVSPTIWSIPERNGEGQLRAQDPTGDFDLVNLRTLVSYVKGEDAASAVASGICSSAQAQQTLFNCLVSSEDGNALEGRGDGLYVPGLPDGTQGQVIRYDENGDQVAERITLNSFLPQDQVEVLPMDARYFPVSYMGPDGSETVVVSLQVGEPAPTASPIWNTHSQSGVVSAFLRGDVPPDDSTGPAGGDDVLINRGYLNARLSAEARTAINAIVIPTDAEIGAATTAEIGMKLKELLLALRA